MKDDLWGRLCKLVAADDGLAVRKAHAGTVDKLFWWSRYLSITTSAMVGRDRWPTRITYVDLFSGPGVLSVEGTRYPGSGTLAANMPKPFDKMIFCELEAESAEALRSRLSTYLADQRSTVLQGDCNALIGEVISQIPEESLTLAFVDPPGLEASFGMLQRLAEGRNVDLLILVPTEMNATRNLEHYFLPQEHSKLDRMLGAGADWRLRYAKIVNQTRPNVSRMIVDVYKAQLQGVLNYIYFGEEVIRYRNMPIYRILFATKHELGSRFWNLATKKSRKGGALPFD